MDTGDAVDTGAARFRTSLLTPSAGIVMSDTPRPQGLALHPLLSPVGGFSDEDLEREARRLYARYCVEPAKRGEVATHDGHRVFMYADEDTFVHAFFTASETHRRGWAKDFVDPMRVARIRWLVPVIGGRVEGTRCYRVIDYGAFTKTAPEKRLYIVDGENYVVWLIRRNDECFRFRTAYVADLSDIERYVKRQRKIWER